MVEDPSRRVRSRKLIEDMLEERRQMLVLLWELFGRSDSEPDADFYDTLNQFLNVLVDYLSAGHFGLYGRIADGNERRRKVVEAAESTYPVIAEITQLALDFSERYEAPETHHTDELVSDLSKLGEALANRIELEDQLILAMLGETFEIPAETRAGGAGG